MEQAGHPVLAAVVMDSDGAQLIGYSPRAGRWGGWLMLDKIIGHITPDAWPVSCPWTRTACRSSSPTKTTGAGCTLTCGLAPGSWVKRAPSPDPALVLGSRSPA